MSNQITIGGSATRPAALDGIQYVTLEGNDNNDGLSWGAAKATVYAALIALPGGLVSPPTSGSGIVYISGSNIPYGGPAAPNGGWWVFGPGDPNYAGGLTGWLRTSGAVTIECGSPNVILPHGHASVCQEYWGGSTDTTHPAAWWSAVAGQNVLRGVTFNYEGRGIVIGVDSTGNRSTGTGTTSVWLDKVGVNLGACSSGFNAGPSVDIGGASFWVQITDGSYSGCSAEVYTIASSGLVRSSNVVTAQTTSTNDFQACSTCFVIIRNASDPTFNGSYPVTGIVDGTHFTYANAGPNVTASGGQAFQFNAAAISINSGTGGGAGYVYVQNVALNNGGIWCQGGFNGCGLSANHLSYEGNGTPTDMSIVEILAAPGADTAIYVDDVQIADNVVPIFGVENTNSIYTPNLGSIHATNTSIGGAMQVGNNFVFKSQVESPFRAGQYGVYGSRIAANSDSSRREFSPVAVRYPNQALPTASWSWNGTAGTFTPGQTAPDGTTNAVLITSPGSTTSAVLGITGSASPAIGETFVWGIWAKAPSGQSILGQINFFLNGFGTGAGWSCASRSQGSLGVQQTSNIVSSPGIQGDGEWQFYSGVCKVYTAGGSATVRILQVQVTSAISPITVYAPVILDIPTGTISDNEAYELANSLGSYPINALAGDIGMLPGQRLFGPTGIVPGLLYSAAGTPLPTCNAANNGETKVVSDATSPSYMGAYTSGGAVTAAVICTGSAWKTH
jgi:hypothetical protein